MFRRAIADQVGFYAESLHAERIKTTTSECGIRGHKPRHRLNRRIREDPYLTEAFDRAPS